MKTANFITSSCRYCRYYKSEGRRGGTCHQLSVPVQAEWSACALAASPFNTPWDSLEKVMRLESTLAHSESSEVGESATGSHPNQIAS